MEVLHSGIAAKTMSLPARMKKCVGPTLPMDQFNTQAAAEFETRVALLGPQTCLVRTAPEPETAQQPPCLSRSLSVVTLHQFNLCYYRLKYFNYEKKHSDAYLFIISHYTCN